MPTTTQTPAELCATFQISQDDLKALGGFFEGGAPVSELIDAFYVWLSAESEYAQFFSDGVPVEVKSRQSAYWAALLRGELTESYVQSRILLGEVHARIGLPMRTYLAGMTFSQDWLIARVHSANASMELRLTVARVLTRMCGMDTALVSESYSRAATAAQQAIQDRYIAVVNGSLDPMITIDEKGTVQFASTSTTEMFGWTPDELIGQNVKVLMPEPFRSEHDGYLGRYAATQVAHILGAPREVTARRKNGEVFDAEICISAARQDDGSAPMFVGVVRDISERKDKERALERLAMGELPDKVQVKGDGDLLGSSINGLIGSLGEVVRQADLIATGDYSKQVKPRSKHDMLGMALTRMTATLKEVGLVCQTVSQGDLSRKVEVKGRGDLLATSVNAVVDALSDAAAQANRIAQGDFDTDVEPKSDKDVLGVALFRMTDMLRNAAGVLRSVSQGDLSRKIEIKGERDLLARSINTVVDALTDAAAESARAQWHKDGQALMMDCVRGELEVNELAQAVLRQISDYLGARVAVLYAADDNRGMALAASRACTASSLQSRFAEGEGMVGQVASERVAMLNMDLGADPVVATHGAGSLKLPILSLVPFVAEGSVSGVLQLATAAPLNAQELKFLDDCSESIAMSLTAARNRVRMQMLLERSRHQAAEVQKQSAELLAANDGMQRQTDALQASELELKAQRAELQRTNGELQQKSESLVRQKQDIEAKNRAISEAQEDLEGRAHELERASRYKSEFLANMSHELRTPLNSLLILSEQLSENSNGHLDKREQESARIIHSGGQDLLSLINDILDLSKVEAGKLSLQYEDVSFTSLTTMMQRNFAQVAEKKGLRFEVKVADNLPAFIRSDGQRVGQILKNLLSNAFKFTSTGSVVLRMDTDMDTGPVAAPGRISLSVTDTGVGIAVDKQREIFEAFQQADGSTSRRYGGTGLGLTISRELAKMLGGHLSVQSAPGKGSTFTLSLPTGAPMPGNPDPDSLDQAMPWTTGPRSLAPSSVPLPPAAAHNDPQQAPQTHIPPSTAANNLTQPVTSDDRDSLRQGDKYLLIVEDDPGFASTLAHAVRDAGHKLISVGTGRGALQVVGDIAPSAVLLDLGLPDMDGLRVLEILKFKLATRHIPVHVITSRDRDEALLAKGAVGALTKPATSRELREVLAAFEGLWSDRIKRVCLVADSDDARATVRLLLESRDLDIVEACDGKQALDIITKGNVDCVILDLHLPDMSALQVLERIGKEPPPHPPVVVHTGEDLDEQQCAELRAYAGAVVVKGAASPSRLLDEVHLFLHTLEKALPTAQREAIQVHHEPGLILRGRKVLLVDDDMRNLFALSGILHAQGMEVAKAENGQAALDYLNEHDDIELVIIDIMMPVLDGYEAMRQIRNMPGRGTLPVIALTAKAMAEDRDACMSAGASDYMTKPVDTQALLELIGLMLFRSAA